MSDVISLIFTIFVVLAAVAAGLWFGAQVAESTRDEKGGRRRSLSTALRETTTGGLVKLWKWQRARAERKKE